MKNARANRVKLLFSLLKMQICDVPLPSLSWLLKLQCNLYIQAKSRNACENFTTCNIINLNASYYCLLLIFRTVSTKEALQGWSWCRFVAIASSRHSSIAKCCSFLSVPVGCRYFEKRLSPYFEFMSYVGKTPWTASLSET